MPDYCGGWIRKVAIQPRTYYIRDEVVEHADRAEVVSRRENEGAIRKLEREIKVILRDSIAKEKQLTEAMSQIEHVKAQIQGLDKKERERRKKHLTAVTQTPAPPATPTQDAATDPPPAPPVIPRTYATVATQASLPRSTTNSVSTITDPQTNQPPPTRWVQSRNPEPANKGGKGKGKGKEKQAPLGISPTQGRAVVLHAAPTKYKVGQMRRWIGEDNKGKAQVMGIRWLIQENRREGKQASSLVIYLKERIDLNIGLRMGRKFFRITEYDCDR